MHNGFGQIDGVPMVALGATIEDVAGSPQKRERAFKTAWFAKAARKAHIADEELCSAIRQVMLGQADDLGGGVFKKRLRKNQYRSIIIAKAGRYWVYAYLFAKQNRANIEDDELRGFRAQAALYARKTDADIARELHLKEIVEICDGKEAEIQE